MHALVLSLLLTGDTGSPDFVLVSPADERPTGELVRLSSGFAATLRTKTGETTVTDAISLRRANRIVPRFPTGAHLLTTSGDRIAGTVIGGDGQFLRFRPSGVGLKRDEDWKLPLSSVVVLWLTDVPANTPHIASEYDWLTEVKNQDVLRFRNGDTARGRSVDSIPKPKPRRFPFDRLGVRFARWPRRSSTRSRSIPPLHEVESRRGPMPASCSRMARDCF